MGGPALRRTVLITNRRGLHARAAAKFVKLADRYDCDVVVRKNGTEVCGSSIMGLMMLAAGPGTTLELGAAGPMPPRRSRRCGGGTAR
ncbi:MAG: HPr family phosphocarrier protein [Thermoanaerobaculia bacterium]|nr:HPr family phosphocarrier protein [Thermoanaerobaculia bacterium]